MLLSSTQVDLELARDHLANGRGKEALDLISGVLDIEPDNPQALFMASNCFLKLEKYGIAYALMKRSMQFHVKVQSLNNLGMICLVTHRLQEAEELFQQALRRSDVREEDKAAIYQNLAVISVYNCKLEEAVSYAEKALVIDPKLTNAIESLGYAHLARGEYAKGWVGHEALINRAKARTYPVPAGITYWMGEPVQSLYIRGEQGVGDEISFASCIPDAMKETPNLVLECDAKLEGLFKRSFPNIPVYGTRKMTEREWLADYKFDAHCLTGTLPMYYRRKKEDFPGEPYLKADPQRRLQWRALLDTLPGKKVGIAWTGGLGNTFKARRSLTLEALLPILKTHGISWVSLQYIDPTDEIAEFMGKYGIEIHHWKRAAESQDYDDQAALVMELDNVVSVTTAVIHLCGALGKEAHVLVPSKPRWFYGLEGRSLPWYKSIELHRQKGDKWPFDEVVRAIMPIQLVAA